MAITTKKFATLVADQVAAIQATATALVDFTVGSISLAFVEATSGVVLWLQGLILKALSITRAATSQGADLDSWMADFGLVRISAIGSSGNVAFSRATPSIATLIPVGTQVASGDGTQTFNVIADSTNSSYSASLNGYVVGVGVATINVLVQAVNAGTQGNVVAGAISVIKTGIAAIDGVTNASAFSNGLNAETDAAFRARFVLFLASLSGGTEAAIQFAILSLNQNLQITIQETPTSTPNFIVTVDDGSGAIPGALVTLASNAVNVVKAAGVTAGTFAASKVLANVNMTIATAAGFTHSTVVAQVGVALANFINGVGLGNSLSYMQLAAVAFGVAGVTDVTNVTLNGGTSDLTATKSQTIKAGTIAVA